MAEAGTSALAGETGDIIFFTGTLGEDADGNDGVTHCGLYVGNNMMVHCGNPCSYANLTDSYWQQHFLGYGRFMSIERMIDHAKTPKFEPLQPCAAQAGV